MTDSISVIVPTYNSASTLPGAIGSIRSQEWPDLEIIVVDDGSSDETSAVLNGIAASDLRSARQPNMGPGAARNRGLEMARGKWVAFLDADDLWLQGKIAAQMELLKEDSSLAFCYSDSLRRAQDGAEEVHKARRVADSVFADLLLGPQFDLPTVIVRRDCFERVGRFEPEFRTGEDWDMWLRLAANFPSCYVPRPLVVCHVSGDPNKYPLDLHERCRIRIVSRVLSRPETIRKWPQVHKHRNLIYAWHYAVLAKSYLYRRRWWAFLRLATAAMLSNPIGLYFLIRRWSSLERWPNLAGVVRPETSKGLGSIS